MGYGWSSLLLLLPYQDYTTISLIPFAHTFVRGVLRVFLLSIFPQKSKKSKGKASATRSSERATLPAPEFPKHLQLPQVVLQEIEKRFQHLVLTSDFNKSLLSPVNNLKSHSIEELARLINPVLPLLFHEVSVSHACTIVLQQMWHVTSVAKPSIHLMCRHVQKGIVR